MKNYICFNLITHNKSKLSLLESHNKYRENIPYLLDEEDRLDNYSETFNVSEDVVQMINVSSGTYEENLRNFYASYQRGSPLKYNFDYLEKIKEKQYKNKGKKCYQTKQLMEIVVSLSNEQTEYYTKQGIDINLGFKKLVQELKSMNIICLSLDSHFDEGVYLDKNSNNKDKKSHRKNYHCHIIAYNYDFINQKSIASTFRKKDYRALQTLAEKSFQKVGLDYKRGISKLITNKKHFHREEFIQKKKSDELKKLFAELDSTKKDLKEQYTLINTQKNTLKQLRAKLDKQSKLYKNLSFDIKDLQKQEKAKKEEHRTLDSKIKKLKSDIEEEKVNISDSKQWYEEIKQGVKDFIKQHTIKENNSFKIKSINEFYKELVDLVNYVSNFDLKLEELEKLKSINTVLKDKISSLSSSNKDLLLQLEKLAEYESKIDTLILAKNHLEEENYELKQFIQDKHLQEDYNSFISSIKKRELTQINR
ncbi:hypothetical protein CPG38_01775 [Malaciobacter marinus]|uniref:hypothetical protein n=1 Tax=Malaciobacter marinus TaxID=505249 RepID=UPI000C084EEE|nr:hypothetical protein [Malaciobacter marinus]PHO13745.1 hypothetical protein CPG38_01775 [Malaciobacter marinus]